MRLSRTFLRVAAACWMVSALTTLGLIGLPYLVASAPPADVLANARLRHDPAYMARVWIGVFHPAIVLVGVIGLVLRRLREATGPAVTALVFFVLWAGVEMVQQSLVLVAVNWTWRAEVLAAARSTAALGMTAGDVRVVPLRAIAGVDDALFFVVLVAFVAANVALAATMPRSDRLARGVAIGFWLAAGLGLVSMATRFWGTIVPPSLMAVLYPLIQPAARFATGVWLWRAATAARPGE